MKTESYKKTKPTTNELNIWFNNKYVNPRTGRKINSNGEIYKLLDSYYKKIDNNIHYEEKEGASLELINNNWTVPKSVEDEIEKLVGVVYKDVTVSDDDIDIITFDTIWTEENGQRIHGEIPNYFMISYKDRRNKIKTLSLTSMYSLMVDNISKHPVTHDKFETELFERCRSLIKILIKHGIVKIVNLLKSDEDLAFKVFQKFAKHSFFIDHRIFMNQNYNTLLAIRAECGKILKANINLETYMMLQPIYVEHPISDITELRTQILNDINKVISFNEDSGLNYVLYYVTLGGLAYCINEIKEQYPDVLYTD